MAIPIKSFATGIGSGGSITLAIPAGTQVGDFLLAFFAGQTAGPGPFAWTELTGWNEVIDFGIDAAAGDHQDGVQWRIADGTEGSSVTFSGTNMFDTWGVMLRISGVDKITPVNVTAQVSVDDSIGTPTPIALGSVVTTVDNVVLLRLGTLFTFAAVGTNISAAMPAGFTEEVDFAPATGRGLAVYTEDAPVTPPGTSGGGTLTFTYSGGFAAGVIGLTIALAPGATGGGGGMGGPGKKPITKADVLAAREHAIATGAKVKTKFDPRRAGR